MRLCELDRQLGRDANETCGPCERVWEFCGTPRLRRNKAGWYFHYLRESYHLTEALGKGAQCLGFSTLEKQCRDTLMASLVAGGLRVCLLPFILASWCTNGPCSSFPV